MRRVAFLILLSIPLFGAIQHSILPEMGRLPLGEEQLNSTMHEAIRRHRVPTEPPFRLMSYNMLYSGYDLKQLPENRWEVRKERLREYLLFAQADLIGSQELRLCQLQEVQGWLSNYAHCGEGEDEINAIFYKKNRFKLLSCESPLFTTGKQYVIACFEDLFTKKQFTVLNCHLSFKTAEDRFTEAKELRDVAKTVQGPLIVTGDFNTFPFYPMESFPFYDGDLVLATISEGGLHEGRTHTLLGHYGPLTSTTFTMEMMSDFSGLGIAGVILDHIMVNDEVKVVSHGIDPARINGKFPSDHLPIIADISLQNPRM
ncbi:MAG: endonuclease/exonuclease/phosphatase family protein [Chlamydiales bacterium]